MHCIATMIAIASVLAILILIGVIVAAAIRPDE
jgi:hypothetical protein